MGRTRFKETFRRVRAESGLTVLKVIATALAAVTIAVVSSQLTSVMNSLVLTFVISISSALINEFYRTVLTVGAESTKAVVAPILGVEDGKHEDVEAAEAHTHTMLVDTQGAPGDTQATAGDTLVATQDSQQPPQDETAVDEGANEGANETGGRLRAVVTKDFWRRLWHGVRHNQVVQMSILFAVVSLITLGISYTMAARAGGTEITVHRTETNTETLSDEERQQLLQEAIEASKQAGQQAGQQETQPTENPDGETPPAPQEQLDAELLEELSNLRTENSKLTETVTSLQDTLGQQQAQIADLLARLEALEAEPEVSPATTEDP